MAESTIINQNPSQWPSDMFWLNMSLVVKITWPNTAHAFHPPAEPPLCLPASAETRLDKGNWKEKEKHSLKPASVHKPAGMARVTTATAVLGGVT